MRKLISSKNYKMGSPLWKYARMIEERRGHNYQHLNDELHHKIERQGYQFYIFKGGSDVTMSESEAKGVVNELKKSYKFVRIVTGLETNVQRIRMYSVIYRKKIGKN